MEQTVYADLLFLINFSMDFLCLFLTSKLLSRRLSLPRAILAASLGGIYAVAELVLLPDNAVSLLCNLGFCLLMCLTAFYSKREHILSLLLITLSFLLASALLGGIMTACFSLLNRYAPPVTSESADIPAWIFCLVSVISALATFFGGKHLRSRSSSKGAEAEIKLNNRTLKIRAMCDSGNLLKDPVSGKPVLLISSKHASSLFPPSCPPVSTWDPQSVTGLPPFIHSRIRFIPTSSVGGNRLIIALRPDELLLHDERGAHVADALVGFADLSGAGQEYKALIPPELIL